MASANRVGQINGEILRALSELLPNLKDPRVRGLVSIVRMPATFPYAAYTFPLWVTVKLWKKVCGVLPAGFGGS